ncbi:MAG: hypothetical protein ACOC4S_00210 [Balneolaceae bacterium]
MDTPKVNLPNLLRAVTLVAIVGILTTGCGGSSTDSEPDPDPDEPNVQLTSTQSHGDVLSDGEGNVLYYFTMDVRGESKCEGDCISSWPAFDVDELTFDEEDELDEEDFGSVERPDGSSQITYKGWPLYYFVGDEQPGDTEGDGINEVWYVAKPDYSLMIADEQLIGEDEENYRIDENGDYVTGEDITTFFTDSEGRTLYIFSDDEEDTNTFTEEDFSNDSVWPIYHTDIEALPSGMDESDFGEITVHGEEDQLTYRGWPVYYFGQDEERGDTQGVSFPQPGAWPIINTDISDALPPSE